MKKCDNCDKIFRTNWHLQRHLRRKYKCVKIPPNNTYIPLDSADIPPNSTTVPLKNTYECRYCLETFTRKDNLDRHTETSCKEKNDVVRFLELKLDIKVEIRKDKVCRFCEKEYTRKYSLTRHLNTCKKKQEYRKELERKDKEKKHVRKERTTHQTTNNNTINNNIKTQNNGNTVNNTININCIGKENMKYITSDMLKQLWDKSKTNEEAVAKTIKAIHAHKDHPENHNIIYTNTRSNVALVKINEDFEYKNINEILKDISANTLDAIILTTDYDNLSMKIKKKYESVCEDDEMNKQASIIAKTELYNSYKSGEISKPS
jgi:hypothetical protein